MDQVVELIEGNYTYITENDWHHNIKFGSSQIEELSTQNTAKDLDGTKNLSLNYNSMKFLKDNQNLKTQVMLEKQIVGTIAGMMLTQMQIILCMLFKQA